MWSVAVLLLVGSTIWVFQGKIALPEPENNLSGTPKIVPQSNNNPKVVPSPASEGGLSSELVSLSAFSERDFRGSDFKVGQVLAENESYTRYYITYESGDLTISGIMNVPKGEGPFPLLLLNHGHIDTSVYTNGRGLKREQDYLARQGFVIIHPDYRNHAESDKDPLADQQFRLGYAEDVINAIGAVKAANLPYIDTERIGMLGHSMGGGVAWRIAVAQPDLIDAFVQFAPVSADERDNFEKWMRRRSEVAQVIVEKHGEPAANPEFWDNISPITFFGNITAPILIHHGTADESVPLEWSQRAAKALTASGKNVKLREYPGEPHEFTTAWPTVMAETTAFFKEQLK
ncbi:MAG: alpha/beta fold hydrolase [Candidatus Andersenbacteria bacterium]|nr:alpha/beta fold hydrolase [Candidatus Andersenbacteria bacterium]MBI3250889.1 alpha/beta fold hydrolase [Candidatus Andersenbacteria bacterium]